MNLQILGVGHSGTTIITRMIQTMGWNIGNADDTHAEDVDIRGVNIDFLSTKVFNHHKASTLLRKLKQPWAIKDPRFVLTQKHWNTTYESMQSYPMIVHVTRDAKSILASHKKRNEAVSLKQILDLQATALTAFTQYPGPKLEVQYEKMVAATKMFDVNR